MKSDPIRAAPSYALKLLNPGRILALSLINLHPLSAMAGPVPAVCEVKMSAIRK
jgi:hypothetical protein